MIRRQHPHVLGCRTSGVKHKGPLDGCNHLTGLGNHTTPGKVFRKVNGNRIHNFAHDLPHFKSLQFEGNRNGLGKCL